MSNFGFLHSEWPQIFADAQKAEAHVIPDPRAACFYARRALESVVAWLSLALNKADCVQFRPNERLANAAYVSPLLNATRRIAQDLILGQTRPRISIGRLKCLKVPVPSLEFQQTFAHLVSAVGRLRVSHRNSLSQINDLFVTLQLCAFRGEV